MRFPDDRTKGLVATGAASGQLDRSLASIVEGATQQVGFTLATFNSIFQRLVAFTVAMSIVETVFVLNLR